MSSRSATTIAPLFLLTLLAPASSSAQVEFEFPLGEHYRIGKYFPVHVISKGEDPVYVRAPGALSVRVGASLGPVDVVVPVLAIERVERDGWQLRPLEDGERLIGTTSNPPDALLVTDLFPDQRIVSVTLDITDPLPASAVAWEALDAVFLDAAAAARVTQAQLATLLAAGTAVAVRANDQPTGGWPWRKAGEWWVARADVPPTGGVVRPDWYASLPRQPAAWPPRVRYTMVLGLFAFTLGALGVSLWRSRRAWMLNVLLCVAVTSALVLWRSRQPPVFANTTTERAGDATDRWTHYTTVADGGFAYACDEWSVGPSISWPVLWSDQHARHTRLDLAVDANGNPIWLGGQLKRGESIAVRTRSVHERSASPPATAH